MINGPRMKTTKQNKKQLSGRFFKDIVSRENIEAIVIAVVLALVIRTFIVQAFKIPSGSMEPTLLIGDHILVNKFIYGITIPFTEKKILQFKKPQRGDVIVFIFPEDPSKDFIKRVIAVEGDQLAIRDKKVFINGQPASDPHAVYRDPTIIRGWGGEMSRDNFGPVTVPPHAVFVMGDNRDKSYDSRFWGYVDLNKVRGRAFLIYWSWGGLFQDFRWNRIGNIIH
jgi:signal peptidase I